MNTINLAYPEKSDIKFKISKFPDGQQDITLLTSLFEAENTCTTIKSRFNSFLDLELIVCATKALKRGYPHIVNWDIRLEIPYLLGARSDRQFSEWGTSYLVDVIAPILNAQNYNMVICHDVHSTVASACINKLVVESNEKLVRWALGNYLLSFPSEDKNLVLMSPDAGASHKIYKLAERINFKGDIITCAKERDENGKLTKCNVPFPISHSNCKKDVIIIDDICDGGNTFINISKELKGKTLGKKYLIITHGIFSKGFSELSTYFDGIFCTNSYSDITQLDYINNPNFQFKQLNVYE